MKKLVVLLVLVLIASVAMPSGSPITVEADSHISFAGYTWHVVDGTGIPGPCNYSESNVWVDSSGYLHMELTKVGSSWYCSYLLSEIDMEFGTYRWVVEGRPDQLNANVVLGLFQYPRVTPSSYDEWDFEWSRWGNPFSAYNLDMSVNPDQTHPDPDRELHQENVTLSDNISTYNVIRTDHSMTFEVLDSSNGTLVYWDFQPADTTLVSQIEQRTIMNLWLYGGTPPSNNLPTGIVIKDFTFTPAFTVGDPTNLAVTGSTIDSIDLEWTKGVGMTKTLVMYQEDTYPIDKLHGTQAYYDTDNHCTVSGLDHGITYYFRAWSWVD